MPEHVVMFSSGIASWVAAKRVAARHGTDSLVLLFADTRMEDGDNYRFLTEAAANVGGELVQVADGRDLWELSRDEHAIANSRLAFCSRELKHVPCRAWLEAHCPPEATQLYVGIDWTETHRIPGVRAGWAPYAVEFPVAEAPHLSKAEMLTAARAEGLEPPRLYGLGMSHANCGGGCVRMGIGGFLHLLKVLPERYAEWETNEEAMRGHLGKDVAILRDRRGGAAVPLTLRALRERYEAAPRSCDMFADDWGGCGCFAEEVPDA